MVGVAVAEHPHCYRPVKLSCPNIYIPFVRYHSEMTTPDKYQNTGKLEQMLDGIQKKVVDVRSMVKGMYEKVSELVSTADSIYDAVAYQHSSTLYRPSHDDLFEDLE